MKILYIQQHFATNRGEAGVRGYNLVKVLADRGHDVTVLCGHNWRDSSLTPEAGRWFFHTELDGFKIIQVAVTYSNKQSFLVRIWSFLQFALLSCLHVWRSDADLIFASSTPLTVSIPALFGSYLRRLPYVLEVRDLWPDLPVEMGIIKNKMIIKILSEWERLAYKRAWKLVGLAPGIKKGIEVKGSVAPERVIMIPNGCDTDNLVPLVRETRKHLPIPDDIVLFGYTGTHGLANGLDAILDAATILKKRERADIAFILIGDGREKIRLIHRVRDENLSNVSFVGLYNKQYYNEVLADLDVGMQILLNVPAFYYGTSPNKFFDYLAAGKPVLVNYPGWMSDLVTEHQCGIAVPPDDPVAFADAVEYVTSWKSEFPRQSTSARQLAVSRFSQQKILHELASFIET